MAKHRKLKPKRWSADNLHFQQFDFHGYTLRRAIREFKRIYSVHLKAGSSFRIIHGYGSSTGKRTLIKTWLKEFLDLQQNKGILQYTDHLNPGTTTIHPIEPLHLEPLWLETFVRHHCEHDIDGDLALMDCWMSHAAEFRVSLKRMARMKQSLPVRKR